MTKRSYNATLLFASALVLLASLNANRLDAQNKKFTAPPKLIVGIAVDQLRTDYLYALQDKFGENGFKKLLKNGLVYEQVTFDVDDPDATAALAVLATGSYPFYNGIPSDTIYNPQMLRRQSVFFDKRYTGINTEGNYSPKALISTTIADELKTASYDASKVYSISPDPESAIINAGHTSDGAIWLDNKTGLWSSTSYYNNFPRYIARQNSRGPLFLELNKAEWEPMMAYNGHLDIMPYHYATKPFKHSFYRYGQPCYSWVKTSPIINDAIVDIVGLFLKNEYLGLNEHTDMLQLTLYAGTFMRERPELYAEELQDSYLRLDQSIANLLDAIDKQVGLDNAFIYLTGTGDTNDNTTDVDGTLIGEFNANRCAALLNSYLISLYGQGQWVDRFDDNQIYLNHDEIEDHKLILSVVQKAAAEFVSLFSGVGDVVTAHQIFHEDFSQRIKRMRNGYFRATGGDLMVMLQPGWALKINDNTPARPQIRHDVAPGPAIIFAPGTVPSQKVTTPVDATAIAPTIAHYIRIRAPSGCTQAPLQLSK